MTTLYYVVDPMCSWCYAFAPTWKKLLLQLPNSLHIKYVMGGLAPHSDEPMPEAMQKMLQNTWKSIHEQVGTEFNFDFWTKCKPRRSTYLACQACISARKQNLEYEMIQNIQEFYYKKASNPSDKDTLINAALLIKNMDIEKFSNDLENADTVEQFNKDLLKSNSLQVRGFPSLFLKKDEDLYPIPIDYKSVSKNLLSIKEILKS